MNTTTTTPSLIEIHSMGKAIEIEYQWLFPERTGQPLIIFLHEGLGSISMWRDWPAQVCEELGCRGLVFSRYGYGQSTPRPLDEARGIDYLHVQAHDALPTLFEALGLGDEQPILYGHSDGGSIALLYAAMFPENVRAIAVAAPHIFVEDITLEGIREARKTYQNTDFPTRLARHHRDGESVFRSWTETWLTPAFRDWNIEAFLDDIRCPVLAIQGVDDEFGTLEQIRGIKRRVPNTRLLEIPSCGHSPHRDQSQVVIDALRELMHESGQSAEGSLKSGSSAP
ncbi:alpha/beta hydrolase [Achromobacter sp. F4_2707]|uniref:alpha/beta fold hydrolase n=1 Tax=Achromobacter sp. F4_2707 TaxID=3114286 RepID=UPI0039C6AAA9